MGKRKFRLEPFTKDLGTQISTPVLSAPGSPEEGASAPASPALIDGKQLAAVLRIKPLRRLHCCALGVCGFGEGRREAYHAALLILCWRATPF